ncbi:MAG: outer membrane protein assembly factor BamD [Bacteroidetes bacterium]|nr:outer membrane protein assembly factor BamD [Bacteroidota bacterium]
MKKNKFIFIVTMCMLMFLVNSCSKFSKIQKSTDMEAKYTAAVNYYDKKYYFQALQLFEELITVFRGTSKAEDTYFYYCQCYFETGEYTVAAYHFNKLNQTFPNSSRAEEALFKNAFCYYLDSPVSSLDQKNTTDAIRQFQLFINRYPQSEKVEKCNGLIDELRLKLETKDFNNAKLYFKTGNFKASMFAFQNVLKTYPATIFKEDCLYYILRSSFIYAGQSVEVKKAERYKITIENYYKLLDAFPTGKYLKESEKIFLEAQSRIKKLEKDAQVI